MLVCANDNTKDTAAASIQKEIIEPHADVTSSRKRSASDLSDCSAGSAAMLSSAPKKRVALRHLLSAASANDDGCQNGEGGAGLVEKSMETYYEDVKEGSQKKLHSYMYTQQPKEAGVYVNDEYYEAAAEWKRSGSSQTKPVAVRPRSPSPGATEAEGTRTSTGPVPMSVVMYQTVGTGSASFDLNGIPDRERPRHKNEAMEQAATAAIRDALDKTTSLHLGCDGTSHTPQRQPLSNRGRTVAIQLGVPDLGIGGSSIDVSAACAPMWTPEQVSITSGIGGMYIAPARIEVPGGNVSVPSPPSQTKGHVVVIASVKISEKQDQNESTEATTAASSLQMLSAATAPSPSDDLPSRIELQRRLHQAESIIENLLTAESQRLQKLEPLLPAASSLATEAVSSPYTNQSQVIPTAADMDPDIEVKTYSSRVPTSKVNNPWNEKLASHMPNVPEVAAVYGTGGIAETEDCAQPQSSSGRVSASSSTSSSTRSFAVAALSAVPYHATTAMDASASVATKYISNNNIKLDQLVTLMDQAEQKIAKVNYHDYASLSDAFLNDQKRTFEKNQTDLMLLSKRSVCFPVKIMILTEECYRQGKTDIVAWNSNGRAFKVWDHDRFENEILPLYLESSKYSSFLRQLNLYGFRRFSAGADKGSYYHPKFLRGLPWIATTIQRTKVNGRKSRKAGNPEAEPRLDDYKHLREPPRDSPYWKLHEALKGSVSSCKQSTKSSDS